MMAKVGAGWCTSNVNSGAVHWQLHPTMQYATRKASQAVTPAVVCLQARSTNSEQNTAHGCCVEPTA